jgi:predicted nucleic acid-binding protein
MSLYVDSSALLTVYLDEPQRAEALGLLDSDPNWASGWHTYVEVRRNLARSLRGSALVTTRDRFDEHWERVQRIELDEIVCRLATEAAEITGLRTLDALHVGAAARAGGGSLAFLTYDRRQAEAARSLGWTVLGA